MSEIKVSVVIPVYNAGKWLEECIDSVLGQTLKEIEVICVDDGSTDESVSILKSFCEKDGRVKLITQENAGAGAARNRGLDAATGEYISFLDADDEFEPEMLSKVFDHSKNTEADICIFRWGMKDTEGTRFGSFGYDPSLIPDKSIFKLEDIPEDFFGLTNPASWNKLYHMAFINENNFRFQEIARVDDFYFTYKSLLQAKRITVLNEVLMYYRIGNTYSQSNNMEKGWRFLYDAFSALKEDVDKHFPEREKDFLNLVVRNILFVADSIQSRGAYEEFVLEVRDKWLLSLGQDYGYNEKKSYYLRHEYERIQAMINSSLEEFIFSELKQSINNKDDLWEKNLILEDELKELKTSYYEISSLKSHIKHFLRKKLKRNINDKTETQSFDEEKKTEYFKKLYSECDYEFIENAKKRILKIPDSNGSRYYKKLPYTIGIVCDQWLYDCYEGSADFIYITYENYEKHIDDIDVLIVYSTWYGLKGEWIDLNTPQSSAAEKLIEVIRGYKEKGVKTAFISVEDPPYYHRFLYIAQHCDYVFTSESELIDEYKHDCNHDNVFVRPFAINPLLHNPIGCMNNDLMPGVLFAGSWYAQHPERNKDIEMLFDGVIEANIPLHIIDRHFYHEKIEVAFPEKYIKHISPAIDHKNLQKIHKLFNYAININSVKDSQTMFAYRVIELQAVGNILLSNYSLGIGNTFSNIKLYKNKTDVTHDLLSMNDQEILELRMAGVRNVMTGYSSFEALTEILSTVGIGKSDKSSDSILVVADTKSKEINSMFASQTYKDKFLITAEEFVDTDISKYAVIAFWNDKYRYGECYIEDMFNGFKYTDSDYITKDAYYQNGSLAIGVMHDYLSTMPDKYRSLFWASAFSKDQLLNIKGAIDINNGYSIDPLGLTYGGMV